MNNIVRQVRGFIAANTSNLDALLPTNERTDEAYVQKFHKQVVDQITSVLNITSQYSQGISLQDLGKSSVDEVFACFEKAVDTLEVEILMSDFYVKKVRTNNNPDLKKSMIVDLVPIIEEEIGTFAAYWAEKDDSKIARVTSTLNRIKLRLAQE